MPFHIPLRGLHRREPNLRIESVSVEGRKYPAPQILRRGMLRDALHKPLTQSAPAMRFQYKHIAHICNGRTVADHARETHLPGCPMLALSGVEGWRIFCETWTRPIIDPEAQRVLHRPRHNLARNSSSPITIRQKIVDHVQIKPRGVCADQELVPPVLDNLRCGVHRRHSFHAHILPATARPHVRYKV